jgi:hypothetical protein
MSAGRQPEETEADGRMNASADVDWGRAQWLSAPNTKSAQSLPGTWLRRRAKAGKGSAGPALD